MLKKGKVCVLLLNWNGLSYTKKCVESLLRNNYRNFEILILDNGSENSEYFQIKKLFTNKKTSHSVRVFSQKKNLGYAKGMNELFKKVDSEFILVTNNDMEFKTDYISSLVKALSLSPKAAICQPKLKRLGDKDKFDYAVAAGGFIDMFGYPFARGRIFTSVENDKGQYDKVIKISWCGIFLAKTEVLKKIKLFDPIYVNYGEDMDLCYRVYMFGYEVICAPRAVGYHFGAASLKRSLFNKMYFHHRNNLIYMIKNFEPLWLLSVLPIRIIFDWLAMLYYIYRRTPTSAAAVLWAHLYLVLNVFMILSLRRSVRREFHSENIKNMPVYRGSIIWEYFIRRKTKFSQLFNSF